MLCQTVFLDVVKVIRGIGSIAKCSRSSNISIFCKKAYSAYVFDLENAVACHQYAEMPVTALISPANLEDNVQIVDFLDLEGIDGSVREPRANRLLPVLVWVLNQHGVVILHISCDLMSEPLRSLEGFIF